MMKKNIVLCIFVILAIYFGIITGKFLSDVNF